jgi:hypothetical protein
LNIYIDESGTFTGIGEGRHPSVVGALVVPEHIVPAVLEAYNRVRIQLPKENGQVKGRSLAEHEISSIIELLIPFPVLFEATIIDTGIHTIKGLEFHRAGQAGVFSRNRKVAQHTSMQQDLENLQVKLEKMPMQLYIQSVVTFELIHTVINHSCLYFAQRSPRELSSFNWVIDAKHLSQPITPWEEWWSTVIPAMLQAKSSRKPFLMMEGADYSYFDRFNAEWQEWAFPGIEPPVDGIALDIKKILLESIRFSDQNDPLLELVDILTGALRRALRGKLGRHGWDKLPKLMIHRDSHYFGAISLEQIEQGKIENLNWPVKLFSHGGRAMLIN